MFNGQDLKVVVQEVSRPRHGVTVHVNDSTKDEYDRLRHGQCNPALLYQPYIPGFSVA